MAHLWALVRQWWPLLLGNILEWYEFGVYGSLTKELSANFFRASTFGTWSGFAVTFLLRPVGGIVFGLLADRVGRKRATLWSMRGMLFATVAQGLLPSLLCCGEASADVGLVLLIVLRALQGVCTGGEIGPLVTYMAESAPPGVLGVGTALFLLCVYVAFVISQGLVALAVLVLGPERMLEWGWRLPFLVALAPGLLTLWGRSHLPESAEFVELQSARNLMSSGDAQAAPSSTGSVAGGESGVNAASASCESCEDARCRGVATPKAAGHAGWHFSTVHGFLYEYGHALVIGFSVSSSGGAAAYTSMWCGAHLARQGDWDEASALGLSMLMYLMAGAAAYAGAVICDRSFGSDPFIVQAVGSGLLTVIGVPVFWGLSAYPGSLLAASMCLSVVFGLAQGASVAQTYLFCVRLFHSRVRALGFGLTFNLAMAYVGGTAAMVAEALDIVSPIAPGAYVSALGLVSLLAVLWGLRLRMAGRLQTYAIGAVASKVKDAQMAAEKASAESAARAQEEEKDKEEDAIVVAVV